MAITKVTRTLLSTGIDDQSNATAITIDSSENVGIGNTVASSMDAGANNLVVGTGSGTEGMTIYSGTANSGVIYFADGASGDDRFRGQIGYSHNDNAFSFRTNASSSANMVLDSSGNVGIGTDSPVSKLSVQDDGLAIRIDGTANTSRGIMLRNTGTAEGQIQTDGNMHFIQEDAGKYMRFSTANTERMRIDSSGNLLVGTTNNAPVSNNVAGVSIRNFGEVQSSVDGAAALYLNRKTSDGDIAVFRKDGTTVGSIAASGGDILIGTGDTAVRFVDAEDCIVPFNTNGSGRDNAINLGKSSERFKDLYLSGGVQLGGTGAANKLDDYEEGSWTPTLTAGTFSSASATYTKVGNMVTINLDAVVGTGGATKITNLPFTCADTVGCGIYASGQAVSSRTQFNWVIAGVTAFFRGTGDSVAFTTQSLSSGATIHASITYRTS